MRPLPKPQAFYDTLTEAFAEVLRNCMDQQEMQLPFIVTITGANGNKLTLRFDGPEEGTEVLSRGDDEMAMPFDMVITDKAGTALHAELSVETDLLH
jgi:hypothetical protein